MGTDRLLYERLVDFLENICEIRKFMTSTHESRMLLCGLLDQYHGLHCTEHDLSACMFSLDGRVFQVEYA